MVSQADQVSNTADDFWIGRRGFLVETQYNGCEVEITDFQRTDKDSESGLAFVNLIDYGFDISIGMDDIEFTEEES